MGERNFQYAQFSSHDSYLNLNEFVGHCKNTSLNIHVAILLQLCYTMQIQSK